MPKYMRQHVFAFRNKSKDVCAVIHLIVQIEHVIPVFRGMALPWPLLHKTRDAKLPAIRNWLMKGE